MVADTRKSFWAMNGNFQCHLFAMNYAFSSNYRADVGGRSSTEGIIVLLFAKRENKTGTYMLHYNLFFFFYPFRFEKLIMNVQNRFTGRMCYVLLPSFHYLFWWIFNYRHGGNNGKSQKGKQIDWPLVNTMDRWTFLLRMNQFCRRKQSRKIE